MVQIKIWKYKTCFKLKSFLLNIRTEHHCNNCVYKIVSCMIC